MLRRMRLVVIGGCGAYPGEGQPCSGYLLEHDGFGLLIDPGYGVATALSRADAPSFDAVLVSHGHPDHCADVNPLLRARRLSPRESGALPVYALPGAVDAVLALDRPEWLDGVVALNEFQAGERLAIGPLRLETVALPHPRPNAGFRITAAGPSMAYTGDCGPSDDLVRLAAGVDLLLAEATFVDEVPEETAGALSSAVDAGRQASAAGVKRLVLTHLTPGTDPAESKAAAGREFAGPIDVAQPGLSLDLASNA